MFGKRFRISVTVAVRVFFLVKWFAIKYSGIKMIQITLKVVTDAGKVNSQHISFDCPHENAFENYNLPLMPFWSSKFKR